MKKILLSMIIFICFVNLAYASNVISDNSHNPVVFLWLVVFIFLSRSLSIVKKVGLPIVVGEILSGVILGDLGRFGITIFTSAESNEIIKFLAELGSIILMFEIGLESKLSDLRKNFRVGFIVALSGSILTFTGGFLVSKYLLPNDNILRNLLFGVITAATATGISAKTFKDMKIIRSREVKIVLVASIIDELFSILSFGIISSMILTTTVSLFHISIGLLQVLAFFIFAIVFGQWITPFITKWSIKIHAGINMKIGVLLIICFLFSWIAYISGLATVIGAFIAGLVLDQIYFNSFAKSSFFIDLREIAYNMENTQVKQDLFNLIQKQESRTLEELIKPLSLLFVPVFFIYIGLMLKVDILFQKNTLMLTLILLTISFAGRIISGFFTKKQYYKLNNLVIGLGMTPIGEAGLIFAAFGKSMGLIDEVSLAAIVATLVISSIITPILIKFAINQNGINQ
ncbi:MAG: cation:proton antiporter [Neisseriaceae bacterium]